MDWMPVFVHHMLNNIMHSTFFVKYGLIGLFLNGLFSSVIPIPTELTASALVISGEPKLYIFAALAASSIIGGVAAYYIGKSGMKLFDFVRKRTNKEHEEKTHRLLNKYGLPLIFFCCWIPVLGDLVPIVAGSKNYDLKKFLLAMSSGKVVKIIITVYIIAFVAPRLFGS